MVLNAQTAHGQQAQSDPLLNVEAKPDGLEQAR